MDQIVSKRFAGHASGSPAGVRLWPAPRSNGSKHPDAKPLKGFGSSGVVELVEDNDGSTYRAVYTVRFKKAVYVLHCFQKKSTRGIATPKKEIDLITSRLKIAEELEENNG